VSFWDFANLHDVTNGRWVKPPAENVAAPNGLSHDSRTLKLGQIYLAIRGENFNGHDFVGAGFDAGAAMAIVDEESAKAGGWLSPSFEDRGAVLAVPDTVTALQQLAAAYRNVLSEAGCKVISVSGSNGKTTTRHLIHHVLTACGMAGTQSPKSFNNHLGVPLTLLAAQPDHDFVACEIGTNHPGEVDALAEIVRPDVAVITSIGEEHLEHFGDLEGVAKEEAAVLPRVRPGGLVLVPADAATMLAPFYDVQEGVGLFSALPDAADRVPSDFPLAGDHNRMNAGLVMTLASYLGLDPTRVKSALSDAATPEGRMQLIRLGNDVTLIHDAYNANPTSMRASLSTLARMEGNRRVAVLGEMYELGDTSADAHAQVKGFAQASADVVMLIGEAFGADAWSDNLPQKVADQLQPGDTVLLKASRGMQLERVIPAIEAKFGQAD
jgi:UDP-N-acetylmuramoyl-tripeptide--D-alanyl-D-alanine ligase